MQEDHISRFTTRASYYDKYRPGYPKELTDYLWADLQPGPEDTIADIAAGTGIFTAMLLPWGNTVYAVEPNHEMRSLAEQRLQPFPNVVFTQGTAEGTTLPDRSIRLITCAQAFHWFDLDACKTEFLRIALPNTKAAIIWNRRNDLSPFETAYEQLILSYSDDYLMVTQHRLHDEDLIRFFHPHVPEYRVFEHTDHLDFQQLKGRTLSYSFLPEAGSERSQQLLTELKALFERHQVAGKVALSYHTRLFLGKISPSL